MYSSARSSPSLAGSGTDAVTSVTMPGVVPQVTWGEISDASISTSASKLRAVVAAELAPRRPAAAARARPRGPSTHSKVVSSGAIIPARPPPSIVMLQTVIRPSIDSASIGGPAYSIT